MKVLNDDLLNEFRAKRHCEVCGTKVPGCEPHHIHAKGMGNSSQMDIPINLIGVCRECHQAIHDDGTLGRRFGLLATVAMREGVDSAGTVQHAIWIIARAPSHTDFSRTDTNPLHGVDPVAAKLVCRQLGIKP